MRDTTTASPLRSTPGSVVATAPEAARHPGTSPSCTLQHPGTSPSCTLQHPGTSPSCTLQHPQTSPCCTLRHPETSPCCTLRHLGTSPCCTLQHRETSPCCTPKNEDVQAIGGRFDQNGSYCVTFIESLVVLEPEKTDVAGTLSDLEKSPTGRRSCSLSVNCGESVSVQDADCSSNDDSSFDLLNDTLNADGEDIFSGQSFPTSRPSAALFSRYVSLPAPYPMLTSDDCFHLLQDYLDSSHTSNTEHLSSEMLVGCAKTSGAPLAGICSSAAPVGHESKHFGGGDSPTDENDSSYPPVQLDGKETSACSSICNENCIDGDSSSNRDSLEGTLHERMTSEGFTFEFPDGCKNTQGTEWDLRTARLRQLTESETVSCYHDCHSRRVSESECNNGDLVHPADGLPRTYGEAVNKSGEDMQKKLCAAPCTVGDEEIISASYIADRVICEGLRVAMCPNGEETLQPISMTKSNGTVHQISRLEHVNCDPNLSRYSAERLIRVSLDYAQTSSASDSVHENDSSPRAKDEPPPTKGAGSLSKDASPNHKFASPRTKDAPPQRPVSAGTHSKFGTRRVRTVEDSIEVALRENSGHQLHIPSGCVVEREPDSGGTLECEGGRDGRRNVTMAVENCPREGVGQGQTRRKNWSGNCSNCNGSDVACLGDSIHCGIGGRKSGGFNSTMKGDSPVLAVEAVPDRKTKRSQKRSIAQKVTDVKQSSSGNVSCRNDLKWHANGTKSNKGHHNETNSTNIKLKVGVASLSPRIIITKNGGQLDFSQSPLLSLPSPDAPAPTKRKSKGKPPAKTWRNSLRDSKGQPLSHPTNPPVGATTPTTGTSGPNWKKLLKFLQNVDTKRGQGKRIKRWKSAENLYQQSYEEENAHRHANDGGLQREAGHQQRSGDSNNRNLSNSSSATADYSLQRQEGGSPAGGGGNSHSPLVDGVFAPGEGKDSSYAEQGQEDGPGRMRKESKSDKKKSSGHKSDTKVTKSNKSSCKSDKKDSSRDSRSSNSSNNSSSSKKEKERKGNSGEDSKGNIDLEDNRHQYQAPPTGTGRSISVNDRVGYGAVTGLDIPPQKLYSTQLDPSVYARNEHLLNRQFSAPSAASSQLSNVSHKGHNSSSQAFSGGTKSSSSHIPAQFSSSLSSNCLSAQDRITGPITGSNGFYSSHSASQLMSVGQQHQHYQSNSSSSNLNGADELTSSDHVTGDLASPSTTTASVPSHSAYNNRDIPEENSPCLSPVSANAPTTWEDALDSDSNLVRYGDETDGILSPAVAEDQRSSGNLSEDVSARISVGMDDGGCETQTMTQSDEHHSFLQHNSSTRSTSSSSYNPNGDRHSTGHQIRSSDISAAPNNALPISSHHVSSEVVTVESQVPANDSGVMSSALTTSFQSVNISSSTATQESAREHRGATPVGSGGAGSLLATDYHSVALYGVDDNSWDLGVGGGNESFSSGGASVAVVSPLPSGLNIPGQDDNLTSRLCTSRTPSPRLPAPASGGESGGDETPHAIGGQSLDGLSRSSESTRSLSSVNHSKEKSLLQASSGADKDKKTKKAWYNVLNPTYKSRSEDLKRLFKDLPNDERLIVDYSCALQKDILVHGRLYVTSNYFCFYSKIFGWETLLSIQCKDIISMTKEKTALVIPNAIQITSDGEKNFFTTFAARDKTYLMLFRIWQNALMDQQMLASELWQWVHSCYGDELGLTSDDDDYIAPSTTEDDQRNNNSNGHEKSSSHLHMSSHSSSSSSGGRLLHHAVVSASTPIMGGEAATPSVLRPGGDSGGEARNDVSQSDNAESTNSGTLTRGIPAPEPSDHHTSSSSSCGVGGVASSLCQSIPEAASPPPATTGRPAPKHSPSKSSRLSSKHSSPAKSVTGGGPALEDSDTPDSEDLSSKQSGGLSLEAVVCPNQHTHHTGREIINKIYAIPIDALFTLLFTNSKMMLDVHLARKTTDVLASLWQSKEDTHQRLRQVTYTVALPTNSFGPKVSHVTETQVMSELTVPGDYYSIDAEASNAGIPYADSFLVSNHWCLTRETGSETRLVVWTSVKYKKSMWGFMKGVIDKNACSGVECLLADIDTALQKEVAQQSDLRQRTRRRRRRPTAKMADADPGAGASTAAIPGGARQQAGTAALLGKESKPVKEPKQAVTSAVTRILGVPVNPLSSHRHAPLPPGGAALQSTRSSKPSSDAAEVGSSFSGGLKLVAGALLLLLLTNMLLYWRLWQLEAIVRGQPSLGGMRGLLDIDPVLLRKGVGGALGEAWLQVLQEQEAAHSRQVEGWREQVAEAASLLNQAEGVLRGLHSNIPEQHAASVRALLAKLRSLDQQHTIAHEDQPRHLQYSGDDPHYLQYQDGEDRSMHHPPVAVDGATLPHQNLPGHSSHFDHHDHLDDDDNHIRQVPDNVANVAS